MLLALVPAFSVALLLSLSIDGYQSYTGASVQPGDNAALNAREERLGIVMASFAFVLLWLLVTGIAAAIAAKTGVAGGSDGGLRRRRSRTCSRRPGRRRADGRNVVTAAPARPQLSPEVRVRAGRCDSSSTGEDVARGYTEQAAAGPNVPRPN